MSKYVLFSFSLRVQQMNVLYMNSYKYLCTYFIINFHEDIFCHIIVFTYDSVLFLVPFLF